MHIKIKYCTRDLVVMMVPYTLKLKHQTFLHILRFQELHISLLDGRKTERSSLMSVLVDTANSISLC